MSWLAICDLMFIVRTRKGPLPSAPTVGVSNKHQLVNLYLLYVRLRWCTKGHKVYTGFEQNVSMSSLMLLMLLALKKVRSRGYKRSREGQVPSL